MLLNPIQLYESSRIRFKELPGVYLKITKKPDDDDSRVMNISFYKKGNQFINLPKDVKIIGICFQVDNQYYDLSDNYNTENGFDIRQDIPEWVYYVIYKRKILLQIEIQALWEFFFETTKDYLLETESEIEDFPKFNKTL